MHWSVNQWITEVRIAATGNHSAAEHQISYGHKSKLIRDLIDQCKTSTAETEWTEFYENRGIQLDDVWMTEKLHILDFTPDFSNNVETFDFLSIQNFYGNFMTSQTVNSNCKTVQKVHINKPKIKESNTCIIYLQKYMWD